MKKTFALLATILMMLFLSACARTLEGVPDVLVEYEIAEVDEFKNQAGDLKYDITHYVDQSTGIDNVSVAVGFAHEYGEVSYYGSGAYQYNKSADIWEIYDDFWWEYWGTMYFEESFAKTFEEQFNLENGEGWYQLKIENIDFSRKELTGHFYMEAEIDGHGYWDDNKEVTMDCNGTFYLTGDPLSDYWIEFKDDGYTAGFKFSLSRGLVLKGVHD